MLLDCLTPITEYLDHKKPAIPRILACIEANNFWTRWHGPMIGGAPDLEMLTWTGTRKNGFAATICDIRAGEQLKWADKMIARLQRGMAWLCSLDSKSVKANKITAGWISDWMAMKPGAATKAVQDNEKRRLLIGFLGRCATTKAIREKITEFLGTKTRDELHSLPLDKLRMAAKRFKQAKDAP